MIHKWTRVCPCAVFPSVFQPKSPIWDLILSTYRILSADESIEINFWMKTTANANHLKKAAGGKQLAPKRIGKSGSRCFGEVAKTATPRETFSVSTVTPRNYGFQGTTNFIWHWRIFIVANVASRKNWLEGTKIWQLEAVGYSGLKLYCLVSMGYDGDCESVDDFKFWRPWIWVRLFIDMSFYEYESVCLTIAMNEIYIKLVFFARNGDSSWSRSSRIQRSSDHHLGAAGAHNWTHSQSHIRTHSQPHSETRRIGH